jgi:hypothetical protein
MRFLGSSLVVAALLLSAQVASADGVSPDPKVILGGGGHSVQIQGNTFSFSVDKNGGGVFDFIAPQGSEDIFALSLTFAAPTTDLTQYTCGASGIFPTCGFTLNGDGTVTALFSGGHEDEAEWLDDLAELGNGIFGHPVFDAHDVNGGVEEGQEFTINLGSHCDGPCGWIAGSTVTGVINPVPEPGTLLLLFAGVGLFGFGRKLLKA